MERAMVASADSAQKTSKAIIMDDKDLRKPSLKVTNKARPYPFLENSFKSSLNNNK